MKKNLVSIIVPYYKKKKYFKKTFSSIQKQVYQKFEVIIIYDDQELDDFKFIKKLIKEDKRFKIILNKKNLGAGLSRNVGIDKAKGEYIAFIDADDVWKKNKLSQQLKFMIKNGVNCSHTSYEIIDKDDKKLSLRKAVNFFTIKSLIKSCDIGLSTVVIKSKIMNKNLRFPNLKTKEDFVLWLKILKKKEKFFGINQKLSFWRKTENSLSTSILQKLIDAYYVYYRFMKFGFIKSFIYVIALSLNFIKKNV